MSVHPAAPRAPFRPPLGEAGRTALREAFSTAAYHMGFTEPRADREPSTLTIRLGLPGEATLVVIDRRADEARTYRLDAEADDLEDRLVAIRGGASGLRARILVDPAACFMRTLVVPGAALPRMRAVLAQELEAATPFRADSVHGDWYVEAEDPATRALRVRHVVLKRSRLDPLLATLRRAGLEVGAVSVGSDEDRTIPVDLLCGGHRALPGLLRGGGAGNLALLIGSALLLVAAFWGLRHHQEATLSALDDAFLATRRAAGPPASPLVQAGIDAIVAGRGPPLALIWERVAASLPDPISAERLRLDPAGLHLTLAGADAASSPAALAAIPGFGPPEVQEDAAVPAQGRRSLVLLPRMPQGGRP